MEKDCRYIESTEYGNYCSLVGKICNKPVPNDKCEDIEKYWEYLKGIGEQVVSEEEIVENLLN